MMTPVSVSLVFVSYVGPVEIDDLRTRWHWTSSRGQIQFVAVLLMSGTRRAMSALPPIADLRSFNSIITDMPVETVWVSAVGETMLFYPQLLAGHSCDAADVPTWLPSGGWGKAFRRGLSLRCVSDRAPSSSDFGPRWISHQRGPFSSTSPKPLTLYAKRIVWRSVTLGLTVLSGGHWR
jgi:hypothetical protein